jgi:hypothetical protein
MSLYKVKLTFHEWETEIEADNEEEALDVAMEIVELGMEHFEVKEVPMPQQWRPWDAAPLSMKKSRG